MARAAVGVARYHGARLRRQHIPPLPRHTHTPGTRAVFGLAVLLLAVACTLSWLSPYWGGLGAADWLYVGGHAAAALGVASCAHLAWDVLLASAGALPGAARALSAACNQQARMVGSLHAWLDHAAPARPMCTWPRPPPPSPLDARHARTAALTPPPPTPALQAPLTPSTTPGTGARSSPAPSWSGGWPACQCAMSALSWLARCSLPVRCSSRCSGAAVVRAAGAAHAVVAQLIRFVRP